MKELKEYIASIRIHDDFRVRVQAFNESDAWTQATHRVQDLRYTNVRIGSTFVLTQVAIEEVGVKE